MSEDSNDILYDIDMQLYDEFNDKIATMNDHLGDVYSFRDIEEVEKAEKEKEIKLLRIAIIKQQKEIEEFKNEVMKKELIIDGMKEDRRIAVEEIQEEYFVSKNKIKAKIEEINKEMLNEENSLELFYRKKYCKEVLQSLLEKELIYDYSKN